MVAIETGADIQYPAVPPQCLPPIQHPRPQMVDLPPGEDADQHIQLRPGFYPGFLTGSLS